MVSGDSQSVPAPPVSMWVRRNDREATAGARDSGGGCAAQAEVAGCESVWAVFRTHEEVSGA